LSPAPAPTEGQVLLVRHAETQWSRDLRHTGRSDIPLTEAGRDAARALAARLDPAGFPLILVSPLLRARETCDLCGFGERAELREELVEWDYGDYEGLTTEEIKRRRPDWYLWRDGCPGGEDVAQVGARADRVIAEIKGIPGPVAIFSHGHMLRVLGARWAELDAADGSRLGLSTGATCLLGYERHTAILVRWNDTCGARS